jgi:hypothetical protein
MTVHDEDWETSEKPATDTLKIVGVWADKSVVETLYQTTDTHELYRRRSWARSSVISAGERWFHFVGVTVVS